jgi:hypothetical protein
MSVDFSNMIGKKLASVVLSDASGRVTFTFADGLERSFDVEGDCCSHSWIEYLEMPGDIAGATLLSVDDSAPITQSHDEHDDDGEISVYNTSFKTDRGEIVLEYRNSSNGYYGGYLVDVNSP